MGATLSQHDIEQTWAAVRRFIGWLETNGYESHDPYDIWGTRYGVAGRRKYYKKSKVGLALISPILFLEMFAPGIRGLFVRKRRYATADAQLALAFLNLHRLTKEQKYLDKAVALGRDLLAISIPGYSGHCWGYPFDWQHSDGYWPRNTPYITVTPYCYEAFGALHGATGDDSYLEIMASIARFAQRDLIDTPTSAQASAGSYSPIIADKVVNTSAYRAWLLFDASQRFDQAEYAKTAERNLAFVLESQREDGSWHYQIDPPVKPFIDHFHTCFVLKGLHKICVARPDPRIDRALENGYRFYRRELFKEDGMPRMYAIDPRARTVELEMYDVAEAITLGALLRHRIPAAFEVALKLAQGVCTKFQLPAGHFITRIYRGGRWRHTVPFMRWPQAQLFYSLTNVLSVTTSTGG